MATQVLEGTWEEIIKHEKRLHGKQLRVTILDEEPSPKRKPNEKALAVIQRGPKMASSGMLWRIFFSVAFTDEPSTTTISPA